MRTDNDICYTIGSFLELLLHLNRSLSSYRQFPQHLKQALKSAGEYTRHDRVYIVEIHHDMTFTIDHEWYDRTTGPTPDKWRRAGLLYKPELEHQLCTQHHIILRDESNGDPEIRTLLKEQNCRQMLLLPLFEAGTDLAFISFLQCNRTHDWSAEEIQALHQLSSVIATHLNNYMLTHRMLHHLKKYHEQKITFLLQYNRLKNIRLSLASLQEKIKERTPDIPEWTEMERHISHLDEICHSLIEK